MNIITISRQFGSGGRQLGRELAALLGYDYYDKEIISAIAANKGMDENYVKTALDSGRLQTLQQNYRGSLAKYTTTANTSLMLEEKKIIEQIAAQGRDCVIVGRNADIILSRYKPLNIFVCADMSARVQRCTDHAPQGENLTAKELEKKIKQIDKARTKSRRVLTGKEWGRNDAYHLTVNTAAWNISGLAVAVADFAQKFFGRTDV
ncbi:MAG: cytidylate kinase-like family protein [Oscillospiraceae bacterium]|nr:cytidylate kinase-like family protein [Oscillospiraceae bacterium]